jgi:hypothetical protein
MPTKYEDSEDIKDDDYEDRGDLLGPEDGEFEDDEDKEEDGEEEVDDEENDEDDGDEDEDEDDSRIPRSRLNQVIRQREEERERARWLEEQLETLIKAQTNKQQDAAPEKIEEQYDFDAAEAKYIEKVLEGEVEEAHRIRKEINLERKKEYNNQIESIKKSLKEDTVTETSKSLDEVRFKEGLEKAQREYPFLNDKSKKYNEKAIRMANSLMGSYLHDGDSKSVALNKAIKDVVELFGDPASKTTTRTKLARKTAAKASQQQPPESRAKGGKAGRSLDSIDVNKLSEKDFKSLTKKDLARLRGDIV